jgi:hypothetical protein
LVSKNAALAVASGSQHLLPFSSSVHSEPGINKLLGMWAAEKLGITGEDAEAYSDALAVGTLDPERSDVLGKIRKDFDAAGVVQSDEQILRVMNELTLQAGNLMQVTPGGAADGLALMPARQLKSQ